MAVTPLRDDGQILPAPQGHAIGFVDTQSDCNAVIHALTSAGYPESSITTLCGDDGIQLMKRMMGSSLWGETAEEVMKQGVIEISHGHFALIVETKDRDAAMDVANVSLPHGAHGFHHFGVLADERLTR